MTHSEIDSALNVEYQDTYADMMNKRLNDLDHTNRERKLRDQFSALAIDKIKDLGKSGAKRTFSDLSLIGGGVEEPETGRESKRVRQISPYSRHSPQRPMYSIRDRYGDTRDHYGRP